MLVANLSVGFPSFATVNGAGRLIESRIDIYSIPAFLNTSDIIMVGRLMFSLGNIGIVRLSLRTHSNSKNFCVKSDSPRRLSK